jgi:hypothetical protein
MRIQPLNVAQPSKPSPPCPFDAEHIPSSIHHWPPHIASKPKGNQSLSEPGGNRAGTSIHKSTACSWPQNQSSNPDTCRVSRLLQSAKALPAACSCCAHAANLSRCTSGSGCGATITPVQHQYVTPNNREQLPNSCKSQGILAIRLRLKDLKKRPVSLAGTAGRFQTLQRHLVWLAAAPMMQRTPHKLSTPLKGDDHQLTAAIFRQQKTGCTDQAGV